jgi:hypothetical protein
VGEGEAGVGYDGWGARTQRSDLTALKTPKEAGIGEITSVPVRGCAGSSPSSRIWSCCSAGSNTTASGTTLGRSGSGMRWGILGVSESAPPPAFAPHAFNPLPPRRLG